MTISGKRDAIILFLGDIFFFVLSLWLTLVVRYLAMPSEMLFAGHLVPFFILFTVWIIVFFISGLYGKHTLVLKGRLPSIILNAQVINIVIAALFFFFIPYFGIAPKTNLLIYLIISFFFILFWRIYGQDVLTTRAKQNAILIGSGEEMHELKDEVNHNNKYDIKFDSFIDLSSLTGLDFQEEVLGRIYTENISIMVIDLRDERVEPILPHLYNLLFAKVRFIDLHKVYEDIFERVPLSLLKHNWFLENISLSPKIFYSFFKRLIDEIISLFGLVITFVVFYPLVSLAIKLEDGGSVFYTDERIGQYNKKIKILKFRTMSEKEGENGKKQVTKVGAFLRKTRIDEFPQFFNVVKGDLSLIGPRPEIPELAKKYEQEISYYNVRHLIKPGLSGWAQIHPERPPKFTVGYEETRTKLAYDLYYIKNRSMLLDFVISLLTIKTIASRSGI